MEERIKRIIGKIHDLKKVADREINDKYFAGQAVGLNFVLGLIYDEFPELAESEDERIRNNCVHFLELQKAHHADTSEIDECIAYLEKQKENPKSAEVVLARAGLKPYKDGNQWCILAGDNIQEGICGFGDTIDEALYQFLMEILEKQKEPAPIPDKFSGLKSLMLQYLQSAANRKDDAEIEDDTDLWGRKIFDYVWKQDEKQKEQDFTHHEADESLQEAVTHQMEDEQVIDDYVRRGLDDIVLKYAQLGAEWQKEQKPAECELEDAFKHYTDAGITVSCGDFVAKPKEQKSAECITDSVKFEEGFKTGRELGFREGVESVKPAEWSEEDENFIIFLTNLVEKNFKDGTSFGGANRDKPLITKEEVLERLKSLRPQPQADLNAIAKREYARGKQDGYWEGVKAERESCKTFHYEGSNWPPKMPDLPTETTTNEGVSSIRPHYKPSEEQMTALSALNCHGGLSYIGQQSQLISLQNDLEKLM